MMGPTDYDPALAQEIQALVTRALQRSRIPAISLEVRTATDCIRVYASAADSVPLPRDARFGIGSVAKLLVGMVAVKLACSGKLDLEASVGDYLPELTASAKGREIRVRHLLSHTSGYQPPALRIDVTSAESCWPEFLPHFLAAPMLFRPGSVFNYHDFDLLILDRLLMRLAGRTTLELARTLIFTPLGFDLEPSDSSDGVAVTGHEWDNRLRQFQALPPITRGAAQSLYDLTLSVPQMTSLADALMGGTAILNEAAMYLNRMQVVPLPHRPQAAWQRQFPISYGYGVARYKNESLGHPGSAEGQCCALRFHPERHIAIAIGLNARMLSVRDGIIDSIVRLFPQEAPESLRPGTAFSSHAGISPGELAGIYVGSRDGPRLRIREESGNTLLTIEHSTIADSAREFLLDVQQQRLQPLNGGAVRVPICFFREPETGTPCLMFGWRAYKQIRETAIAPSARRVTL